jgi:hypothetical protein
MEKGKYMILSNVPIHYCKLHPKKPNATFDKENPTWECQIRTTSRETKEEWEKLNLNVKLIDAKEGMYWRVNLKKRTIKRDGTKASPVVIKDRQLREDTIDPDTIGHGSIANVRIFQYPYKKKAGGDGIASVLMGIQITKLIKYVPKPRDDDFEAEEGETEVIGGEDAGFEPMTDDETKEADVF